MNPFTTSTGLPHLTAILAANQQPSQAALLGVLLSRVTTALLASENEVKSLWAELDNTKAAAECAVDILEDTIEELETQLDDAQAHRVDMVEKYDAKINTLQGENANLRIEHGAMKAALVRILDAMQSRNGDQYVGIVASREIVGLLRLAVSTGRQISI